MREEQRALREAIDGSLAGTDDMETGKQAKRACLSTGTLQAIQIMEWMSPRRLPFTVYQLAEELELTDTSARRHLRTLEIAGWVNRADDIPTKGNPLATYRVAVRVTRLPNGS